MSLILACETLPDRPEPGDVDPDPDPDPVSVIDLSNWYLTLPVDDDNDGKVDIVEQPALDNYQNNSKVRPYLYNGSD